MYLSKLIELYMSDLCISLYINLPSMKKRNLNLFIFIEVELTYNIVLVSGVQQSDLIIFMEIQV